MRKYPTHVLLREEYQRLREPAPDAPEWEWDYYNRKRCYLSQRAAYEEAEQLKKKYSFRA
jgi:hypothetical protein